jgi:ATP-dependent protease ClpP protease subunit
MKKGTIYISGVIGQDTTLLDVIRQAKSQSDSTEFDVKIDSIGGYVDEGMSIYNYLKNLAIPVTTITSKAYSIASVIFLAGQTRIVENDVEKALMIHLPWAKSEGSYDVLTNHLIALKEAENEMIQFYSQAIDIDESTIKSLLENETFLNSQQAYDLGFATEIQSELKAVAILNNKEQKEQENFMNKITKKLDSILNMLSGKVEIKAELKLQDATGVELVFADLESTQAPEVDAKVTIDGKPADGEFTMADGSTLTAVKGVVTEITPVETEIEVEVEPVAIETETEPVAVEVEVETEPVVEDKDAMIAELESTIVELKATIAEMMSATQAEALLTALESQVEKQTELENKFQALAKSIGSDFSTESKEVKVNVKAKVDNQSRAFQILNS